ncbi:MAG: acireductone dioxygenase [Xanthomonadaceae bacterium]|jgi:1,2-dihydroxy-3-keto-5-methylthiopentene dioxygenase|nr:acireductone dioxygenase [Xanthomonadaceae bacterium]
MSRLRIFANDAPEQPLLDTSDTDEIIATLCDIGVTFERWQASRSIEPGAAQAEVLAAYRHEIDRLIQERGFNSVDVVSIAPDTLNHEEMRKKFLEEHYHKEDEVRFFVAGSGQFNLHVDGKVYEVECVKDDLIGVPDRALHWFDMGAEPYFVSIRFFTEPDGWVGYFSDSGIASKFPRYEPGKR